MAIRLRAVVRLSIFPLIIIGCNADVNGPSSDLSPSTEIFDFVGEYGCFGNESGVLAFAAELSIDADGTVAVDWFGLRSPNSGTWVYEEGDQTLVFSGDYDLATGTYMPETRSMRLMLKDGIQRAHAEGGEMDCNQRSS